MKKNNYLLILFLMCLVAHAYGQTLTINEFKAQTLEYFDEADSKITAEKLASGFTLRLKKAVPLSKAEIKGNDGNFAESILPLPKSDANFISYEGIKMTTIPADGIIEVKIYKDNLTPPVVIKLKPAAQIEKISKDCKSIINEKIANCTKPEFSNKFGFLEADFDTDDVIYVYDFNNLTHKRRFYKISFEGKKGARTFDIRKVNLSKETLPSDKQVWISVANVNQFMYEVSIDDTLAYYDSEPSALFSRMFIGDSSSLLGTLMTSFGDKIKASSHEDSDVQSVINAMSCFNTMYADLQAEVIKAYDPCSNFNCCNNLDFKLIIGKLNEVNSGISLLQLKTKQKENLLSTSKTKMEECEKKKEDLKKLNDRIAELKKLAKPSDAQKTELNTKTAEAKKIVLCKDADIQSLKKTIAQLEIDISAVAGLVSLQAHLPKVADLRALSVFILNRVQHNQHFIKGPIALDGNRLDLTVKITTIDTVAKLLNRPQFKQTLQYEIPIVGRPFVSFSSGSFVAPVKRFQNTTYAWKETVGINNVVDSVGYTLAESGTTSTPVGFSALGNIEWKLNRFFGVGASIGVGLTIENNPRLAYLAGGSLFFGNQRQFVLTYGISAMQVDHLVRELQTLTNQGTIYGTKADINYYQELKFGSFVSVSYTPFTMRKK